jgi:hypothetical protein
MIHCILPFNNNVYTRKQETLVKQIICPLHGAKLKGTYFWNNFITFGVNGKVLPRGMNKSNVIKYSFITYLLLYPVDITHNINFLHRVFLRHTQPQKRHLALFATSCWLWRHKQTSILLGLFTKLMLREFIARTKSRYEVANMWWKESPMVCDRQGSGIENTRVGYKSYQITNHGRSFFYLYCLSFQSMQVVRMSETQRKRNKGSSHKKYTCCIQKYLKDSLH